MAQQTERISNRLAELRESRGFSAARLAALAGATRQTIYAIEAGNYTPNTALALRLARVLEAPVEALFQIAAAPSAPRFEVAAELLPGVEGGAPGGLVQLCTVGGRTMAVPVPPVPACLPAADGVILKRARSGRRAITAALPAAEALPDRLLIAGCDPALSLLASDVRKAGVEVIVVSCNSSRALRLLREGRVHIAGTHLCNAATGESGLPAVRAMFPRGAVRAVTFASWRQGFLVAPHNPRGIREAGDLARQDVRVVNREAGAGSRMLLDLELRKAGLDPHAVRGYGCLACGHLTAAWQVANGLADCCVATEAAARAFGLDFLPLRAERFDFVFQPELVSFRPVQRLLDRMLTASFRRVLTLFAGYDTARTGEPVI